MLQLALLLPLVTPHGTISEMIIASRTMAAAAVETVMADHSVVIVVDEMVGMEVIADVLPSLSTAVLLPTES
jgi:phosphatidylglycerophosphatase A